jgi:hypothetical protein
MQHFPFMAVAEFDQLRQDRYLREVLRAAVWRQGDLEFMVCEDYTLANIESRQVTLTPEPVVHFITPSDAWRTVLSDYDIVPLQVRSWRWTAIPLIRSVWLLQRLVRDPNDLIRQQALRHPALSLTDLVMATKNSTDDMLHLLLAQRPDATPEILIYLGEYSADAVIEAVIRHPNTPTSVLHELQQRYEQRAAKGLFAYHSGERHFAVVEILALLIKVLDQRKNEPL